jgi:hypothetical protein
MTSPDNNQPPEPAPSSTAPPTTRPRATPGQRVLAWLLVLALGAAASAGLGYVTSYNVGVVAFLFVLVFTLTYRSPAARARARATPPKPAALPSARIEVRGAGGHLQRAGAKLKHAVITGLVVVFFIGAYVGVAYVAARLKGPRRAQKWEREIEERRQRDAERAMWEQRCPGMSAQACQQAEPFMRQLEEKRRRREAMTLDEQAEELRRDTEELRRKYPQHFPPTTSEATTTP